jgi:exopolysaccharide production protein ExoQ
MPPLLASVVTVALIVWLFRRDWRVQPNITGALWIPILWMFIIASMPVSTWLGVLGLRGFGAATVEEGSTVDSVVYFSLILAGVYVLSKRQVDVPKVIRDNTWLTVFVVYCFLSIFWSDFPFVSFKRWIKILGHPIMVLVLFTEPDPHEAFIRLMKRCAYVLFPVSILWMKYYPTLGRRGSEWGGMTNVGIAGAKNELGAICFIWGLFFFWHLLSVFRLEKSTVRRDECRLTAGLLLLVGYCLWKAHSSTSEISLLLGSLTILVLGLRFVNVRMVGAYAFAAIIICFVAQSAFDVYGTVVDTTGHTSTIEGRAQLWATLLHNNSNPIFGAGFEGFWLGGRLERLWQEYWWHPTQAHNGYLELYLNLGAIGLLIFIAVILVTFQNCKQKLVENFEWGRLSTGYLVAILAHNWTEAGFKGLSIMFLFFFLIAVKYPEIGVVSWLSLAPAARPDENTELAAAETDPGRPGGHRFIL